MCGLIRRWKVLWTKSGGLLEGIHGHFRGKYCGLSQEGYLRVSSACLVEVGLTMRIPLLCRDEYSQWSEWFMNYLEEQTDEEAMINSIKIGEQPLHVVAQVSLAKAAQNAPPTLKDLKFLTAEEKKTQKIDRLARSLLI
uniref:Uncharacterized protein n=1 Tax=Tanacetum cinerariifolium TaxID=118510 RepID=A0A699K0S9_TANCI|nr:hypothetical protein [Tanacetum cinerariifolium]